MKRFPPRLAHQPIFYPVANAEYAQEIAARWNVEDEASGFSGFVTRFRVSDEFLSRFERQIVGANTHVEYWIPAGELTGFNNAIEGQISVPSASFGSRFQGWVPKMYGFTGKNAIEQFVILSESWSYSLMDFTLEISANRKAVYLNSFFWAHHDFSEAGIDAEQKHNVLAHLNKVWASYKIEIPLPSTRI